MSFEDYINRFHPNLFDQYELYERLLNNAETFIGIDVIATRSGFGCGSEGGTHLTVFEITAKYVRLKANSKTRAELKDSTFSCDRSNFHTSFKLADPDMAAAKWYGTKFIPIA